MRQKAAHVVVHHEMCIPCGNRNVFGVAGQDLDRHNIRVDQALDQSRDKALAAAVPAGEDKDHVLASLRLRRRDRVRNPREQHRGDAIGDRQIPIKEIEFSYWRRLHKTFHVCCAMEKCV
jgi:hypothetical protein